MNDAGKDTGSNRNAGAARGQANLLDRIKGSRFAMAGAIILIGLVLTGVILFSKPDSGGGEEGEAESGALSYARGPQGARLLSDTALQLEVTIYETGVEPHFRVYPYDAALKPLAPRDVNLQIELHRLGGRVDRIQFRPEADYLLGTSVVEEPHSFDVKVIAQVGGRRHEWTYSQIEGKVRLGADQMKSAGIVINTVGPRRMLTTLELPAEIKADETRLAHVVPRLSGVVMSVLKKEGDFVRRGEVLAVLNSRELATAQSAYLSAVHRVEFARVALQREESLWKKKISAEQDYLEAKHAFEEAALSERLAGQMLVSLGIPQGTVSRLQSAPRANIARFEIRAPLDGRVTERNVTVGESVTAEQDIFTVADLSQVWVDIMVPAKDLAMVHEGQEATVLSTDLGMQLAGRISYVGPIVGQETRAAVARVVIPNPSGSWRPGLFVKVQLVRQATMVPLAVASEAIQTFRDWQVVFVRYGDWFEARPLELGRTDGQWVEVLSGLLPGEQYAAANSFAVKAEIGKLGATHDH